MPVSLPDGLLLRTAQQADLDQIAHLLTVRGEPADAVDHRLVVEDPDAGWDCCAVVVDGDRVVSTATLLDETLFLGGVAVPAGQVELVATNRAYEGRGLVRALMDWAHRRSAQRGHLAQVMIGIPYFYRQFGYQYAIDLPQTRGLRTAPPVPDGHLGRIAGPADLDLLARQQDEVQQAYDLRMPHSTACWRWLVARDGSQQLVVERGGQAVASGRLTAIEDDPVVLGEVAAVDGPAAQALLGYAIDRAGGRRLRVKERPGSVAGDALEPFLTPRARAVERYYVRVADVVALLERLRPVLSARLATSPLGGEIGEAVVSFFRHHVRIPYAAGEVGPVQAGGRMQAPGSVGGAGVAPDLIGPLLFGPDGIAGLVERHPDVYAGRNEALMATLFPPVRADLLTFYLP
ncbi:MAG TPA: GNAT family N-acetyltransferase [Micromonosporaceae bacterium]